MYRQDMLRSLGHNMKDPFYEYFDANWETCKEEWVDYLRDNVPHLNNHTNNRIESGWGKIKQVVDREDPIDELISTLVMLQEWSEERYMKEFKCLGTRQPPDVADAADPELVTLAVQLSHHAYRLVRGQYQYACSADAAYEISINGATAMLLTKRGSSDHSVHEVNTKVRMHGLILVFGIVRSVLYEICLSGIIWYEIGGELYEITKLCLCDLYM
ncbi:hypothetical protein PF006_g28382 [Phytophthora fragariae]|nr:hypothetical protein PF009_g29101 [Phytophthora fragariae]KAE9075177.1 hypothetical protein PF006_g28382 [Phytophthora fragariae]